jgi:hypothetical protein
LQASTSEVNSPPQKRCFSHWRVIVPFGEAPTYSFSWVAEQMVIGTVLFEILGSKTVLAEREENLLEGDFAGVQWRKLRDIAEVISRVIAKHTGVDLDALEMREAYRDCGAHLAPLLRVYGLLPDLAQSTDTLKQVMLGTARALMASNQNQSDFFSENLLPDGAKEVIDEYLFRHGGKGLSEEIVLLADGGPVAQLTGRYAPRPIAPVSESETCVRDVLVDDLCYSLRTIRLRAEGACGLRKFPVLHYDQRHHRVLGAALVNQGLVAITYAERLDATGLKFFEVCAVESSDILDLQLTPSL